MERVTIIIYKKNNNLIKFASFCAVMISITLLLTGCVNTQSQEQPVLPELPVIVQEEPEEEIPIQGGELRVPLPIPYTLNPLLTRTKALSDFLGIVFEGLFTFGEDSKPVPVLAQSWEVRELGRVLHIKLRDDVRFHDGVRLTAEDVVFTFNALRGGLLNSPFQHGIFGNPDLESMIVDEENPFAVYVQLFEPINNLPELLTFPILPQHIYQTDAFMTENRGNLTLLPVGTGPFKADNNFWDPTIGLRLERNEDWWNGYPLFDYVRGIVFEDANLARNAFMRGDIDVFDSADLTANQEAMGRNAQKHSYLTHDFELIGFNHRNPILSDIRIRRAIAYAVDKRRIVSVVYNNAAQEADAPILPSSWLYKSGHGVFEGGIERAVEQLEEAGFRGIDEYGIRIRTNPVGVEQLKLRLLTNLESSLRRHAQQLIADQLKDIGILVEIQILPMEQFVAALRADDFDMVLLGYNVGRFPDVSFTFSLGDGGTPFSLYSSDELNSLLKEAERVYVQEDLVGIYDRVQDYINNRLPIKSLYFRTASVFIDERIKGFDLPFTFDIYKDIEKWYFSQP